LVLVLKQIKGHAKGCFMKTKLKFFLAIFILCSTVYAKKRPAPQMVLLPNSLQTTLDQEHEFKVEGGKPPYVFKTSAGLIRYQGNTAIYISPNAPGDATVTVKDAAGAEKVITITVMPDKVEQPN
jgi:hypothetical protein